jgi:hypothetical protein
MPGDGAPGHFNHQLAPPPRYNTTNNKAAPPLT